MTSTTDIGDGTDTKQNIRLRTEKLTPRGNAANGTCYALAFSSVVHISSR